MGDLHPMVVHAPIVCALLWPLIDFVGVFRNKTEADWVAVSLLVICLVTSVLATTTGQSAYMKALDQGWNAELLNKHRDLSDYLPWLFILLLALRWWLPSKWGRTGLALVSVLGLLSFGLVIEAAHRGGELVYEHGVGVSNNTPKGRSQTP